MPASPSLSKEEQACSQRVSALVPDTLAEGENPDSKACANIGHINYYNKPILTYSFHSNPFLLNILFTCFIPSAMSTL